MKDRLRYVPHALALTAAGYLLIGCGGDEYPRILKSDATPTPYALLPIQVEIIPSATPTPDINATSQSSIGATVEARTDQDLKVELEALPDNLRRSAVKVVIGDTSGTYYGGSGIIIGYDEESGIGYGMTASHVVPSENVSYFSIQQPQYNGLSLDIDPADLGMTWMSPDGICIFAFRNKNAFRLGRLGETNILTDWEPNPNATLYTLGFPSAFLPSEQAVVSEVTFPSLHRITGYTWIDMRTGLLMHETDNVSAPGSSGTVVVTEEGDAIGLLLTGGDGTSDIYLFGDEYYDLVESARNNLENR